jgi:pimeloyl-ACP methyl ester carboxylesterase
MKVSCHCDLRTSRNCALKCIAFTLCILTLVRIGFSQTLSATSGINPQDTYVVFDLGVQSSGTVTLPDAVYSPSTRTVSTAFNVSPLARTMHVEAGYDTNGNLVMNLYLNPTTANPYAVSVSPVGVVRYAQGQVTLFDTNNLPISPVMPNSSLTALLPSWLQVSSKGASLIGNFRVSNIRSFAVAQNASLNLQGSTASLTFPSGPSPQVVWTYTQSGSYWVPSQVQVTPTVANGAVTHTLQFSNLAISDNATNDASRASQFPTLQSPAASNSNVPALDAPEVEASCTPGGGETNHLGGTQNIAFQHGFMSDPSTWVRMVPWLNQDFILGTELLSATDWCSGVADQANTLEQEIQSAGGSNYIIVAHSLGGLVSRDAAQHFQSTPTPVRGVATMNTPHLGADLAANGPPALGVGLTFLSNALYGWMGCGSQNDNVGCFDAWLAANGGAYIVGNWAPGTVGAVADMTPGSALLNQLNNPPQQENFLQAGITAYTPQRWLITREMDEMFFGSVCYPESKCGERAIAADTEYLYDATETNFLLDLLLSQYCEESLNCPNPYTDALGQQMNFDAGLMGWMNAIDGVYDAFMGCNFSLLFCEGSDGLIQFSSQQYPESTATQYPLTPPTPMPMAALLKATTIAPRWTIFSRRNSACRPPQAAPISPARAASLYRRAARRIASMSRLVRGANGLLRATNPG